MNIIFIIYVFVLFILTSPNVLIKITKVDNLPLTLIHGLVFTFIIYITNSLVLRYREGVKIGTIEENGNETDIHLSTDLGLDKLITPNNSPAPSTVVNVNNTILDYSNYTNTIKEMSPLPGPVPNFFKDAFDIPVEKRQQPDSDQEELENMPPLL